MRVWDIPTEKLCRNHLLGEHREIHALWSILTKKKKGYAHHPETKRWKGKLKALYLRHKRIVAQMRERGYEHSSSLPAKLVRGAGRQDRLVDSVKSQIGILRDKKCACRVWSMKEKAS